MGLKMIAVHVTESDRDAVRTLAMRRGHVSVSDYIRALIEADAAQLDGKVGFKFDVAGWGGRREKDDTP